MCIKRIESEYFTQLRKRRLAVEDMTRREEGVRDMISHALLGVCGLRSLQSRLDPRRREDRVVSAALGDQISRGDQGGDVGRILVGLQVPKKEMKAFREFLAGLGYRYWDESENPAYKLFLG